MNPELNLESQRLPDAAKVRWYVLQRGWKPASTKSSSLALFNGPPGTKSQIQVPTGGSDSDVRKMMWSVILKLANVENRPAQEILNDLSHPFEDVLQLRMNSRLADAGTLPLGVGLSLFQGGKELLLAAACSAHKPQASYARKSYKAVDDFIDDCKVGQTMIGSYVATIITPSMPPASPVLFPEYDEVPFSRQVTLNLMRGLQALADTVRQGESKSTADDEMLVSANLCDAISSMSPPDEQGSIQIEMNWSTARPNIFLDVQKSVRFATPDLAFIGETGRRLRHRISRQETVTGKIVALKSESSLLDDSLGIATVRVRIDGKPTNVRFELSRDRYIEACNAHRDGKPVRVNGTLQKGETAKLYELIDPREFTVLADE